MIHKPIDVASSGSVPRAGSRPSAETCRTCALRGAEVCRAIQEVCPSSANQPIVRKFKRGKLIARQDGTSEFLGVIRRGYARRSTVRISGKRVLLGLAVPGDIVGGFMDQPSDSDFEAGTDVELCLYDKATVKHQIEHNPRFRQKILQEMLTQHRRLLGELWRNGTLNSRERITAFLVTAAQVMPVETLPDGGVVLSMEIDRRDWADLTNTTVETISRTLRDLEEKGLITSLTPYRFKIRNIEELAALAVMDAPE
ncbi:MAG: Crp/Fnr family transcriptional regulator [Roseivivax sp.]|nr:Crp/Fnr family transcriptional regulator [Roseivivax sp.]